MRGQGLRQAAALARQASTLAAECSAGLLSGLTRAFGSNCELQPPHSARQVWTRAGPAIAAVAELLPRCLSSQSTLATLACKQQSAAQLSTQRPWGLAYWHSLTRQQQSRSEPHQQLRFASAQAEPLEASSSSSGSGGAEGLSLSDSAVQRLKQLQAESSSPITLRITVEGGGCSGFQYEFAMEEGEAAARLGESDRLFVRDGVRVVCDDISLEFLRGATVDFESDLMRSAFVIQDNPNAASSCGCGSSFVAK